MTTPAPIPASAPVVGKQESTEQFVHCLANGLTLVAERIPNVRSAAMTFLVPAGAASDPPEASGAASVLSEWILRGAGDRDSHELTEYLDGLGLQRGASAESVFVRFGAQMLAKNLLPALAVYGDVVQRPRLPEDGFAPSVDLAIQQIESVEDEPSHKLSLLLKSQHYDYPYGRPTIGEKEQLEVMRAETLRDDFSARYTPQGAILSVAGMFDWAALKGAVEGAFGDWTSKPAVELGGHMAPRGVMHVTQETNQVQIGLAYDTLPEAHSESLLVQIAMNVLSGGMGARLFTEIREKQGLCYSVHAGYHSMKDRAAIFGYAGTAPDRAQQTLDSFLVELNRLKDGVTQDEFDRAIIGIKSRLIMQGESSGARAGAIAYDYYHRDRPRTLAEVRAAVEAITLEQVNAFLAARPPRGFTFVTIGPNELKVNA